MIHIFHKWTQWKQFGQGYVYTRNCKVCEKQQCRTYGSFRMFD